jgi:serine/threonine-protein kinase
MTSTRNVTVAAGATATLVVPLARVVATSGQVSVQSPIDLEIFVDGTKVGVSSTSVRLPAGRHTLDLLNAALEFRTSVSVEIPAGGNASAVVTVPKGKLSINALPWADVALDGRPIGQTPLANLDVPIGTHEVIWRHPQLGERRQTVVVKAQTPTNVGMDLNR